jgi:hypothetical protein
MNRLIRTRTAGLMLAVATAAVPLICRAQDAPATGPAAKDPPRSIAMAVRAAKEPLPAFKYRLIPPVDEQTPGNGAPLYLNGFSMMGEDITFGGKKQEIYDVAERLLAMPMADLAKSEEATSFLNSFSGSTRFFELAGRRERIDWETPIREDGFAALLPSLNHVRQAGMVMAAQARTLAARGDVDGAIGKLKTLFALAHALDANPVLVQSLVGAGVAELGLKTLEDIQRSPGCPNLYWALADLPHPMFNAATAMQWERSAVRFSIPALRGRADAELSSEDWQSVPREFPRLMQYMSSRGTAMSTDNAVGRLVVAVAMFPRAKAYLVEQQGFAADRVEAMPAGEVLGRWMIGSYERWSDEQTKWARVPVWQAAEGSARAERALAEAKQAGSDDPVLGMIPSLRRAQVSLAAVDRHAALLQLVEAIRDYAAKHEGRVPKSLADVTNLPPPIDPMTNQPFEYTATSDSSAQVLAPTLAGESAARGTRVDVTIQK